MSKMAESIYKYTLENYKIKVCGKRSTYLVPLQLLGMIGAKPWSRQRPVDEERVAAIGADIEESKDVSGIISLAWHPSENLVVYDGQHRWTALKHIHHINKELDIRVFIEIIWEATEADIVKAFKTINQSVSVAELYLDPAADTEYVKVEIQEFVAMTAKQFSDFVSISNKPNRPNFNRDLLTNELYKIWSDILEKKVPFNDIVVAIMKVNKEYHANPLSSPRTAVKKNMKTYEKCEKANFWLFAETGHINVDHLKAKLNASS